MERSTCDDPLDLRFDDAELEEVTTHIQSFIRTSLDAAGVDRAVLGLSGGIDSTTTAHLTVDAIGADALHGLVMPAQVSDDENMSDAERVARDLGIDYDVVAIDPYVEVLLEDFPHVRDDHVAVGNAYARTRAIINYLVANHEDALVLGTGNRSEALVGYFTKFGDGAVDCHPLGNLYKQQVRQIARYVGVPEDIVEKTPTAGLWVDQTDEDELGIDYDTLDSILALHVDGHLSPSTTARTIGIDRETVERIASIHERSEHKRSVPPAPEPLF